MQTGGSSSLKFHSQVQTDSLPSFSRKVNPNHAFRVSNHQMLMKGLFEDFLTQCCVSAERLLRNLSQRYSLIDIFLNVTPYRPRTFFNQMMMIFVKKLEQKKLFLLISFFFLFVTRATFSLLVKSVATKYHYILSRSFLIVESSHLP